MATVYDDSIAGRGFASSAYAAPAFAGAPSVAVVPGAASGFGEGGLLGTLLLMGLLGGNGLGVRKDCVDQSALNALQGSFDTNAIMGKLASIESSIPFNEAQVQLALANAVSSISTQANANCQYLGTQLGQIQIGQLVQSNAIQNAINTVDTNVDRQSTAVQAAIHADGEATRALITSNRISDLESQKVILANEVAELRSERNRDRDRHSIEISMTNNQNQNQLQAQAQQQQIQTLLTHFGVLAGQVARATNANLIVGNTGATTTGPQTANPVNVAA